MIHMKHTGIYVADLKAQAAFYKKVFSMIPIYENVMQEDKLIEDIFGGGARISVTKLITERGKETGVGDMIELLQVLSCPVDMADKRHKGHMALYETGCLHISFGVHDMELVVKNIEDNGGRCVTNIHVLNGKNKCCMCQDPEGNWLELIENL